MPRSFELSHLDNVAFEHLANAIAMRVLGAGLTSFAPGPDGGRDGWFEGEAPYPSSVDHWSGTWYVQSKFHAPHLSKDPQKWIQQQIRAEVAAFAERDSGRRWPTNWIVATNVDVSATAGSGTFDQARRIVKKHRARLAPHFHIWGGQKIIEFLGQYPDIAERYGHFLTPGHVLTRLLDDLDDDRASVQDIVRYSVVRGIEDQRHTRLEQAGSADDRRPGIDALFVDLPYLDARCGSSGTALKSLSQAAAATHSISQFEALGPEWVKWAKYPTRAPVWFVRAGPGRGKSSVAQFFCQIQRAALVIDGVPGGIHPDVRVLAARIKEKAISLGSWPLSPRIPLWVELKTFAEWFAEQGGSQPRGVASYLTVRLQRDIEASVSVKTLRRAMATQRWAVIFDGLDEVPSDVKDKVAVEVVKFIKDVSLTGDVFAVCTSRPQGYAGQFDDLNGAVVDLVDLTPELALECASKVAGIDRSPGEATRASNLLRQAIQSPAVRELLTTPLQAHIMAVLVRTGTRPPERKWDLYHKFYEVIREREANRSLPDPILSDLFQRDPALIDAVHQKLGFALHSRAERATGADASLTKAEFRALVTNVVREVKPAAQVERIVDALLRATTERLVLINTPDQGDRVRFDIRAIQEFFRRGIPIYRYAGR